MTRTVFLGTPSEAIPSLEALSPRPILVVTRPDQPRGRARRTQPSPVKEAARRLGLPLAQPATPAELLEVISAVSPVALGVVTAFGMLLKPEVLGVPRHGFINVHLSLLPRWRGAAPVVAALLAGDEETGVTIMRIDQGLDTGPILAQRRERIRPEDNGGSLSDRLARLGADLLVETVPLYLTGALVPRPQPNEGITYAPRITAEDRRLGADQDPLSFVRRVRALAPRPGAHLTIDDLLCRVLDAAPADIEAPVGECLIVNERLYCGLTSGAVEIRAVQPEGKRVMSASEWLRGVRLRPRRFR